MWLCVATNLFIEQLCLITFFSSTGLVDAKDANDFERKLGEVKESWNGMERKINISQTEVDLHSLII
jgi:hypothetical protein